MEQTNNNSAGDPQSERRIDSSRWRADAEAANERARREEQRAFQERREQEARARAEQAPEQLTIALQATTQVVGRDVTTLRPALLQLAALLLEVLDGTIDDPAHQSMRFGE